MRLHDGRYECGDVLDIPVTNDPKVVIVAASGQPNMRALLFEGREIHRCEIMFAPPRRSQLNRA